VEPPKKQRLHDFLRTQYRAIAEDPKSTTEQRLQALHKLDGLILHRKNGNKRFPNLKRGTQKASALPVEVEKKPVVVSVNEKLLGSVES